MANVMEFPDTVEEFMEQYRVTDTDHVYSNGTDYVPIFRMKQWFEHLQPKTNADRFKAMSDMEIASFFYWDVDGSGKTQRQWLEWLRQECAE